MAGKFRIRSFALNIEDYLFMFFFDDVVIGGSGLLGEVFSS